MAEAEPPGLTQERWERAIVVGAGIAGLMAATAVAPYFAQVLVVERDELPKGEDLRPGVPQAAHPHGLFVRGGMEMDKLLPGLRRTLEEDGAPTFDLGEHGELTFNGRTSQRITTGSRIQTCSRNFLEWRIREQVQKFPNVEFHDGMAVTELRFDHSASRVTGVGVVPKPAGHPRGAPAVFFPADLVLDASGRNSRLAKWLGAAGILIPEPSVSHSGMEYASCLLPSSELLKETCYMAQEQCRGRGAAVIAVEHDRMMMITIGTVGDPPPADYTDLVEWAQTLSNPLFARLARSAPADVRLRRYGLTSNRRHGYDRMGNWPDRLIAIGDSYCVLNPVYGQGMTVAALEAAALRQALAQHHRRGGLDGISRPFQRRLRRLVQIPWTLAVNQDSMVQATLSPAPSLRGRMMSAYINRIYDRLSQHPQLFRTLLDVQQMNRSPLALLDPRRVAECLTPAKGRSSA